VIPGQGGVAHQGQKRGRLGRRLGRREVAWAAQTEAVQPALEAPGHGHGPVPLAAEPLRRDAVHHCVWLLPAVVAAVYAGAAVLPSKLSLYRDRLARCYAHVALFDLRTFRSTLTVPVFCFRFAPELGLREDQLSSPFAS